MEKRSPTTAVECVNLIRAKDSYGCYIGTFTAADIIQAYAEDYADKQAQVLVTLLQDIEGLSHYDDPFVALVKLKFCQEEARAALKQFQGRK